MTLWYAYGVRSIVGVKCGFEGFYLHELIPLRPWDVVDIHNQGGSILKSSRGALETKKVVDAIAALGINQIYCIGGDGTHKGIHALAKEV